MSKTTIVFASGDFDRLYSALIIGTGTLAMGDEVSIYFTFFGLQRLTKRGLEAGPLSRINFLGLGRWMLKRRMRAKKVITLPKLMADFKDLGGKIIACDMTIEIMGISKEALNQELIDEYGAVGTWWNEATKSNVTLFI